MGRLVFSQRLDLLAKALAEEIAEKAVSPLQMQTILVPKGQMKSWLLLELAKNGIVAGCKILTVREWIRSISKELPSSFELASAIYLELQKEEEVSEYVQKNGSMDLAEHLLPLFQQYGEYAPQFFSSSDNWQQKILHKLFVEGPFKAPVQILASASKSSLYCFGIDFLPECYWNFFSSIYLFSPCLHFWGDVCSDWEKRNLFRHWKRKGAAVASLAELENYLEEAPSLLANWGKLGRQTLKSLDRLDLPVEEAYEELEPQSMLQKVQSCVLHFEKLEEQIETDDSLRIFQTGSSRFREVEVLCEEILRLAREEQLLFSDMAVFACDLNAYAPLIELLFSRFEIPYRMTGVETKSLFLQGLDQLLDLVTEEWSAQSLCALLKTPSFFRKLDWEEETLETVCKWARTAMDSGIEALLNAFAMLSPEQSLRIEMGQAKLLEQFIALFQALSSARIEKTEQKSLSHWASFLETLAGQFLVCEEEVEQFFQNFLTQLRRSRLNGETFPFEWVRRWLKKPRVGQIHANHLHAVRIAPFVRGNMTLQKALFLLGMDEEGFPRKNASSSLNLLKADVPERATCDRYLFLRALFSTTEFLRISYGHISKEEGKPIEPSPVVTELLHFLNDVPQIEPRGNRTAGTPKNFVSPLTNFRKTPSQELPEGEYVVSLSDLSLLMRHPWKFYLRKILGIRLEESQEESFSLQKAKLLRASLSETPFQEMPRGLIGKAISLEIGEKASEWKKLFTGPLSSVQFLESCRKKTEEERPCIEIALGEKTRVRIVGEIEHLSSDALVYPGKADIPGLLKIWPKWLCAAYALDIPHLLCLKSEKTKTVENPKEKLEHLLRYFFAAQSAPSPLLPEWADALLRKGVEELEKKMAKKNILFEDPILNWAITRFDLPSARQWEANWGNFLRTTFGGLHETI